MTLLVSQIFAHDHVVVSPPFPLPLISWTTPLAGGAIGSASGVVYSQSLDPTTAAQKSYGYRHDKANVHRDDLYIIGGVIGALLTPAICECTDVLVTGSTRVVVLN